MKSFYNRKWIIYDFNKYVDISRWHSYYHQIKAVCECGWKSVLLVWIWDWIVVEILRKLGFNVTTFDFDEGLNPDIVWDVKKIDEYIYDKYDIVVCSQVLEHIPFELFEATIKRICKITKNLLLSLPNKNIRVKFWFYAPILGDIIKKIHFRMFWKNQRDVNKEWFWEHYWEVDALPKWKKYKIEKILKKYFNIEDYFVSFNNTYHMFRRLSKK